MTQGARICPHCKRRVDERRAKGLAYCLSCGQPLAGFAQTSGPPSMSSPSLSSPSLRGGTPPPSQYGAPPSQVASPYSVPGQMVQPQYGPPAPQYGNAPAQNFGGAVNPYATQPQPQMQGQMRSQKQGGGSVGLIIGILVGLGGVVALIIAVLLLFVGRSSSSSSSPTASDPDPTSTVAIETPTASTEDKPASSGATATHHPKPSGSSSSGKNGEETAPNGTQPFPFAIANEKMDQAVLTAERICPRTEGPFGTMIVDVTFETDGRVGTLSQKPIGGTPEGNCVTAQFLEIHVGVFAGSSRTFPRSVTLRSPNGSASPTSTGSSGRTTRADAGH